ncbi:S-layer family protein [Gloeocapsa sp. PCC 73106]|uniref:beta strand repeat-containing protein n=1 Tax=Gloeocapsa sp. PCC 73106 TaxID=102232 RepID=UPI0002ACFBE8|nr:Calx-beta domain-containing protein [Gloeocapsa sp. PCC 73106]ELR99332.1 FG-GAP repeat protein [Gloeocapsa sp. PCC 73106]
MTFPAEFEISNLNGSNGFAIDGVNANDRSGVSVSSAGDINDDGIDDLIIGAHYADPNGSYSGQSYVVFGRNGGFSASLNLSTLNGSNGFTINGINSFDQSGVSVSSAGDINGDGIDDLIIGAPNADTNGFAGQSYVVFGRNGGFSASLNLSTLNGSNGFAINGVTSGDSSGSSVSSAGDINGDGIDDLIIGAHYADPNGSYSGQSYVVFGSNGGFSSRLNLSTLNGSNGFTINGINSFDRSGRSVSSAGDINGDGIDDLIIGASGADPNGSSSGQSYVVFGSNGGFSASLNLSSLNGSNGFTINGINAYDNSGSPVSNAGDINSDGIDDLIIKATRTGQSYVVFGSNGGFSASLNLSSLNGSNGFTINAVNSGYTSGESVSSAGDINGDGIDDLIIGATGAGQSSVVFGSSGGFNANLNLSSLNGSNGFTINGINSFGSSSSSLSSAGDVNGDGIDDLIIGATGADPNGRDDAGQSYVIFGRPFNFPYVTLTVSSNSVTEDGSTNLVYTFTRTGDISIPLNNVNFNVGGTATFNSDYTQTGASSFSATTGRINFAAGSVTATVTIDPMGDSTVEPDETVILTLVTGNGYAVEIPKAATGAITNDDGFSGQFELSNLNGSNGFTINGINTYDFSGVSVSSAGDINGDGIDDLIIGATGADPNGSFSGQSYVVFGRNGGFSANLNLSSLNGSNGFTINGINADDRSGGPVSSAGDINGDGLDDLVLGAYGTDPNGSFSGQSYVVFGRNGGFSANLNLSSLNGSNGFTINGVTSGDFSGSSVSSAGDINGDGLDDLIIGADGADPNGASSGQSYVVFGSNGGFSGSFNLSSLNGSNGFTINGVTSGDFSGSSVSSAGDINGDGIDDLIIGAFLADPNGKSFAGQSYVVFGSNGGFSASLNLSSLNGSNGFAINGVTSGDLLGSSVSGAGDINGDGLDDLIIGATDASPNGRQSAGRSYVVFGSNRGFSASLNLFSLNGSNGFTINGINTDDSSGGSVSSAGDINGDGLDDLIIGASGADPNGIYSGQSYVVFGSNGGFSSSLELSSLNGSNGFALNGVTSGDLLGFSVSGAGDINGDGLNDLIIGAFGADSNGRSSAGQSYVVFGRSSTITSPNITLTVSPSSVTENGTTNLVYTFTRTGSTSIALNDVNFNVGGTAGFNNDYTQTGASSFNATTGRVNFAAGSATATVTVDPTGDSTIEPNETAMLTLATGTGYTVGTPNAATSTIANDDFPTTISVRVSPTSVTENGSTNLVYTFTRTGSTSIALNNVNFMVGGTATFNNDYTQTGASSFNATTGRINFAAGSNTAMVTVDPTGDSTLEPNETAMLTLATGTGYTVGSPNAVTGTIANDDFATISVRVSPTSVTENGATNLVYTFTRTGSTSIALNNVNFRVGGTATFNNDYTQTGASSFNATTGRVNFAAGSATARVTVDPRGDSTVESNETAMLTLATGTGYTVGSPNAATGTIANDDLLTPGGLSLNELSQEIPNLSLGTSTSVGINTIATEELTGMASFNADFNPEFGLVM